MSDTPKYTTITTYEELSDGTVERKTEKYHERLASINEERIEHITTDREHFLNHLMQAIRVITEGKTRHLSIEVKAKEFGQPALIVKSYTTYKKSFNKR